MPHARVMAAAESLLTLVDFGNAFLRRRRMQATGGSNSVVSDFFVAGASAAGVAFDALVSLCWDVMLPRTMKT